MILTDYFKSTHDICWDYALQCGVKNAVVRLPEDAEFDVTDLSHWQTVYKRFTDFGVKPIIIEPMPNSLHDHIKSGDELRDCCIEKAIKMLSVMDKLDIRTICFNFMAYIGWLRTDRDIKERGGATVTGFDMNNFCPANYAITKEQLWDNYTYFIKAIMPYAEKYNITFALHPDDPPLEKLGQVERIMISADNIERAVNIVKSDNLGITMCQATYAMMGENLYEVIPRFADKIKFIHFRNATGNKYKFHETFHDNGSLNMGGLMRLYKKCGIDVPIRVDHVPTLKNEASESTGYEAQGRLFAIGYLKGILDGIENEEA